MAIFSFLSGGIPSTAKFEEGEAALSKDYKDFQEYTGSDELKRFEELEAKVNSDEFAASKKEIMGRNFKNTDEYRKEQEYLDLKKSKPIKNYYKIKNSKDLVAFNETKNSEDLTKYEELSKYVGTEEFNRKKQEAGKEFKDSEDYTRERDYLRLRKSPAIKKYYKFKDSPGYQDFLKLDGSGEIAAYEKLEQFVNSEEFTKVKEYMSLSAKKKYEQSEESKIEEEYLGLKKSEKINWYFKLRDKNEFHRITDWELTFEDDFDAPAVDSKKWMNNYFWGEVLLKDSYALPGDKQFYTGGNNIEIDGSVLKIVTRKEQSRGKLWDPAFGFREAEFDYTSGLISTGRSFRQKYGRFKARIRMNSAPIRQAGWMLSDTMLPHVDLVKFDGKKINMGSYWGRANEKGGLRKKIYKSGGSRFTGDFYVYSIDWSEDRISWSINGKEVLVQTENVPQDPMYIVFSSGVTDSVPESRLPSNMEIDYVRVYRKK